MTSSITVDVIPVFSLITIPEMVAVTPDTPSETLIPSIVNKILLFPGEKGVE